MLRVCCLEGGIRHVSTRKTVGQQTKAALKETEQAILEELNDLVFIFDMQEYQQERTGQFIEVDLTECVRLFLNIRVGVHHRLDLLAAK